MTRWRGYADAVGRPDELTSRRLERRVLQRFDAARPRSFRRTTYAGIAALGVAAALLLMWWVRAPTRAGADDPSRVAIATSGRAQALSLPHGGTLWVAEHSRIELASSEASGAVVRLHDGEVTLHVHSGPGLRWRVEVDGFGVEAVGTRFRVRRTSDAPDVDVEEGVVRLTGPGLPTDGMRIAAADPEVARADTDLAVAPAGARAEAQDGADREPAASLDATAADGPDIATSDPRDRASPMPTRARPPAWLQRFRDGIDAGDGAAAVDALPEEFPTGREALSSAEFLDAGDALAGQRQPARADSAYRAACKRTDAPACGVATFRRALLAARRGDPDEAIRLATQYLRTYPEGSLTREVLGRRMQWRSVHGSMSAARADASDYLALDPDGPHAELARNILGAEPRDP